MVLGGLRIYEQQQDDSAADDRHMQPRKSPGPGRAHFPNHRDLRTVGDEGLGIGERDWGLEGLVGVDRGTGGVQEGVEGGGRVWWLWVLL